MYDFIEFVFPCDDCLVSAACKDKKRITKKDLLDQKTGSVRCLAMPNFDPLSLDTCLAKVFISCMANMAWKFADHLRNEDRSKGIPEEYRHFLIDYLAILQYVVNTTSWVGGMEKVADFDKDEIRRKLDFAKTWLR